MVPSGSFNEGNATRRRALRALVCTLDFKESVALESKCGPGRGRPVGVPDGGQV